jgi:carboxymethylenebutenolidase
VVEVSYPAASGTLQAYLSEPSTPGPWPGVVVVHELFGLTADIRRQADRFAEAGYLALAPDLYSWAGTVRCLVATIRTLAAGHGRALDDLDASRQHLAARPECTGRVGIVGFCLGGGLAVLAAPRGFAAAAPNYGQLPRHLEERVRGACPVVASYGGKDPTLRGAAAALDSALSRAGVTRDVKEYPQAKHGFLFAHSGLAALADPVFVHYDPDAADDAWRRMFAFFEDHLKGAVT